MRTQPTGSSTPKVFWPGGSEIIPGAVAQQNICSSGDYERLVKMLQAGEDRDQFSSFDITEVGDDEQPNYLENMLSRREWIKVAGVGACGVLVAGSLPGKAQAVPAVLPFIANALIQLATAIFVGVVADLIVRRITQADWSLNRRPNGGNRTERLHYVYSGSEMTDLVIPPTESSRYRGYNFAITVGFGRTSYRRLDRGLLDLNAPEAIRISVERSHQAPYCVISERQRFRPNRDRDLFRQTIEVYSRGSFIPRADEPLTPEYTRELTDRRGNQYTGYGVTTARDQKNFLIAQTPNWR